MATVALSAVGNAFGPIGGIVGGIVGGFIDNALIFPSLFQQPTIEGQRLDGLSVQSGSEGSPINFSIGRRTRVAGTVVWVSDIEEVATEQSSGGKGGSGGSTRSYSYYASLAIAINEGGLAAVQKVFADAKVIQTGVPTELEVAGTSLEVRLSPDPNVFYFISRDNGQGSFVPFRGGVEVESSGFANSENNGTFMLQYRFLTATGHTGISVFGDSAVTEAIGADASVTQTIPNWTRAERITFLDGDAAQSRDTIIEADKGTAETPAFRGTSLLVIVRLALADFGNRIPNINAIVERADPTTLKSGMDTMLARSGVAAERFDTTALADHPWEIEGYNVSGPTSGVEMVEPLMLTYDLGMYENAGKMVFYQRGDEPIISGVTADELSVHTPGSRVSPTVEIVEIPDYEIPAESVVNFIDAENDYQQSSQKARRVNFDTDVIDGITIPIAMSPSRARQIAERRLWVAASETRKAKFSLPPKYLYVTEGDIVPVTLAGNEYKVRLDRVTIGANWMIECEGVVQGTRDFDFAGVADEIDETDDTLYFPPGMVSMVWSGPPLRDSDAVVPGYYWATCAGDIDAEFLSASVFRADTESSAYSFVGSTGVEATIFQVLEDQSLGDVDDPYVLDRVNSIEVRVLHGALSTASEADFLNGANRVRMANGEIIGFQTVAAGSEDNQYVISNLMRGLRNTEAFTGTHEQAELGVVLNGASAFFEPINISDDGNTDYFKIIAQGGDLDDVPGEARTLGLDSIKPFAPYALTAYRDPTDATPDVVLGWVRRTRSLFNILAAAMEAPLLEGVEKYEVDLLDPTGTTVESTYAVGDTECTVPTADVVVAGYAATDPIKVRVYQISGTIGRGNALEGTV